MSERDPQIRFDQTTSGGYATSITALALSRAAWDHTRSWCGSGSLRADATFDVLGAPNHINVRPHEVGRRRNLPHVEQRGHRGEGIVGCVAD